MNGQQGQKHKKILASATGLGILFLILILINVIVSYANVRWDTTADNIFSLSQGSKNILGELKEPVNIKFFCSKSNRSLPRSLKIYAKRVRDFLSEYEYVSNKQVTVEEYDPKVDSDEEEWAQRYGVRAVQLPSGDRIYCGLVLLSGDQEERIAFLDPSREELLEYDITRIIHSLQSPKKKVVGIISTLPVLAPTTTAMPNQLPQQSPWVFVTELKKTYEVQQLDLDLGRIDSSVDLLIIVHPKQLSQKAQFAIDQYILAGGNGLIFVDPYCISDASQNQRRFMQPPGSTLDKLFAAWGISMAPAKVVADLDQATRIRTQRNTVESSPVMISARSQAFNESDVVTSKLENMLFPIAGAITKTESSSYDFEPLVQSGKSAALIDAFKASLGAAVIRRDFAAGPERLNLAVRVRGKFDTAFPAGPPGDQQSSTSTKDKGVKEYLKKAEESRTIIVVADADMLADPFFVQKSRLLGFIVSKVFNDNLNFVSNASEVLTGSDDLIGLRSRGRFERPFTTVSELERSAQDRWLAKEKELVERVEETNRRLRELEQQKDVSQKLLISPEQEAEIEKFREEKRRINGELKQVRKNLRADIEALGVKLKWLNILLMPLCVSIAGIGFAIYRQRRMKRE
ncbi:MAG: Gldg family protein [Deltaproteobacteria bacterium]|nr:MAG: Gldg family protein [Deltaproteobacteria bacterium]